MNDGSVSEWWGGLLDALAEASYEWWRGALQIGGAAIGFAVGMSHGERHVIFMIIGAIYGSLAAGLGYHWREILRGESEDSLRIFLAYLGATAGFTYRFFLSGVPCTAARLVFSPFYAGLGAVAGIICALLISAAQRRQA